MKANQLFVCVIAAAAGCGAVMGPETATGDDQGSGSGATSTAIHGSVLDERNDAIDFASGEPVHTHGGAPIDLSSGCPDVYLYGYLETRQAPLFGRETTPNPLAWHVDAAGATQVAYRVRTAAATLRDWTPMTPVASGSYTIELHRDDNDAMQTIGRDAGQMYVDARITDTSGIQTTHTACWQNHPLAAPLHLGVATPGSLFDMTFSTHSQISAVINDVSQTGFAFGADVVMLGFEQQTLEPTRVIIALPRVPTGMATREIVNAYVPIDTYANPYICSGPCAHVALPTRVTTTQPLSGVWQLRVVDDVSHAIVCRSTAASTTISCSIPARDGASSAHGYHAVLSLGGEPALAPTTDGAEYVDALVGTTWVTGTVAASYTKVCSLAKGLNLDHCAYDTDYKYTVALNQAKIDLDAVDLAVTTATGDDTTQLPPSYVVASTLTFAAKAWDAGSAGL